MRDRPELIPTGPATAVPLPGGSAPLGAARLSGGGLARAVAARVALPLALLLWLLSLRGVALDRMRDLGLLQVLPPAYWAAVVLLTLGFVLALYDRRTGAGWLTGYVLGLIAVIHATPALLYPVLRYSWAWKHLAIIDAMMRHGGPVPNAGTLAIYNQWPGFFALNALFLRATGLHSALGYAQWTPPVVNALLLAPLLLLYRTVSHDRRLVWGAAWIFYSCSWVGQDYFSPQAFAFLLYVVVLAVVFRQLAAERERTAQGPDAEAAADAGAGAGRHPGGATPVLAASAQPAGSGAPGRAPHWGRVWGWEPSRLLLVLLIEAAIISSHQLTPLMLVTVLAALSLPRRNRRVTLPLLVSAVVMVVAWGATVARPYISANLRSFGQALLSPDGNAVSGLAGLGSAAPGQVVTDLVDRSLSAAVFLLAAACFVRRPWTRRTGIPLAVLSPLPLLAANSYGGEIIFRVYLFALPAMAFMVAALVLRSGGRPPLRVAGVSVLLLGLLGGLFVSYDSKEQMNWFTRNEVDAAAYVTGTPPGSVIVALTDNVPGIYQHYDDHRLVQLYQQAPEITSLLVQNPLAGLDAAVAGAPPGAPAYLVFTRGQEAQLYLTGLLPKETFGQLEEAVSSTPGFSVVYRNPDAVVYRFVPNPVPATGAVRSGAVR
ncbi:glycosyltransferase [Streptacidiphilus sp. PB12-B1b]|uniref:glycosyltransferase n=1 Tax=Streptacidiphilus sp. PB12-B1b TaxID=2705012 RepID=UPI0015FABD1B|nr:glycosyltransferase [Streptacidiphilus sp. PB12-B1b]